MARKKKRWIGPTKEALTKGLATAEEGKVNRARPQDLSQAEWKANSASRTQKASQALGEYGEHFWNQDRMAVAAVAPPPPKPLDIQLAEETLAENTGAVLEGQTNLADYGNPQTPQEARTRAIIIGYFQATHKWPSADKVMMLSQSPIQGTDPEVYRKAWEGAESLPEELARSDFFQDSGYENLHGFGDILASVREKNMGLETSLPSGGPLSYNTYREHARYIRTLKEKRGSEVGDFLREGDPVEEYRYFVGKVAERLRRRGAPVLFDPESPWGDKDALAALTKYASGRQLAFALFGTNKEQTTANDTLMHLNSLPLTKDQEEMMMANLGVDQAEWGDQNTIGTVIDALRNTDDETVHKVVYDAWMFGRPVGQSPSQARFEFAEKFGIQRLPAAEREKYETSNRTLMGLMGNATTAVDAVWEQAKEIPAVGHGLAAIGWVAGNTFKAFNYPIEYSMRALVTCYDIANSADRGMTLAEYQDYLSKSKGEDVEFGWNWSIFTDTAAWAQAWEESEGKTPITELMNTMSLSQDGKIAPWAQAVGQMSDFSVMMYIGAKLDPVVRGAVKGTYVNAVFPAGKAAEKYVRGTVGRYKEAPAVGEWVFKKGEPLPDEAASLIDDLIERKVSFDTEASTPQSRVEATITKRTPTGVRWSDGHFTPYEKLQPLYDWAKKQNAAEAEARAQTLGKAAEGVDTPTTPEGPAQMPGQTAMPKVEVVGDNIPTPSRKPLWELTREEAEAAYRAEKAAEKGDVEQILGAERAKEWRRLDKQMRRSSGKDASAELDAFEKTLTKAEYNAIYGIGEDIYGTEALQSVVRAYRGMDFESESTLADSIRTAVTDIGDATDPAKMNTTQMTAFMRIRYAFEHGTELGLDMDKVQEFALKAAAERFQDAETAAFMLARYTPEKAGGSIPAARGELPAPSRAAGVEPPITTNEAGVKVSPVEVKGETVPLVSDKLHPKAKGVDATDAEKAAAAKEDGLPEIGEKIVIERDKRGGGGKESVEAEVVGYDAQNTTQGGAFSVSARIRVPDVRTGEMVETGLSGKWTGTRTKTVDVDASVAPHVKRLNKGGYPTTQSHGAKADHPAGHPARKAEPYVEFAYEDLRVGGTSKAKMGLITGAAKRAGAVIERQPGRKTFIVRGDVGKFTDELMGPTEPPAALPPAQPPAGGVPPTPLTPPAATPLENALFRTNAEVIATVDDPTVISFLYDLPEGDMALKSIAGKLARTQNLDEVNRLLRELQTHGVDIDGGAAAVLKNMRQSAYRKGIGYRTPFLRGFIIPQTYGKTHSVDGGSDMTFNVAAAVKLGKETVDEATWARIRDYRRRVWEADRPLAKQRVLDEMWDEIEANLGEAGMKSFEKYKSHWYAAQGRAVLSGARRAYLGRWVEENGEIKPGEASRVGSKKRAKAAVQKQLDDAEAQLDELLDDAPDDLKAKRNDAVTDARKRVEKVADAADVIDELGMKDLDALTGAEAAKLARAQKVMDEFGTAVPFKMGQSKNHLVHRHNPRILSWYQSGISGRAWGLVDQAVADPLMTIFKETVMASLGFPLRVNIGDEAVRLIPEGTLSRMRTVRAMKKELKEQGMVGDELRAELHDRLAYDWVAQDMGDWVLATKGTHPRYYQYLAADIDSWKREPIVQRLIAENKGEFPTDVTQVRDFIRRIADEETDLGREMRAFLADTYRFEGGLDNPAFMEWTRLWEERLTVFAENEVLRRAMTKSTDIDALKTLPDEVLWPVNAPSDAVKGVSWSPATVIHAANRVNPFHYLYQGVTIPKTGTHLPGSVNLLGKISNSIRDTVFADRYYLERKAALARNPHIDPDELHKLCSERAFRHTNRVTYSRSATVAEDMARNLLPFVNAYRQFWQYWGSTFLRHPISISVAKENYELGQKGFLGTVSGGRIAEEGSFQAISDYQAFLPSVPFWGMNKDEDDPVHGVSGFVKEQVPMASFLVTGPARTAAGALGVDSETLAKMPFMTAASSRMAPFSRQGRIMYGLTGFNSWDEVPGGEFMFGDPEKLEKAHTNALIGQMVYDAGPTGPEEHRNKPWWWKATEEFFHVAGLGTLDGRLKVEALFAEAMKTGAPVTISYAPKRVRERSNWLYEYYNATRKGKTAEAAQMRAGNEWLDTDLAYYDATYEEQLAMKKDPANAEHLKFWVSPYNYDKGGSPYNGYDWQQQFTMGLVNYKTEDELVSAIHNLYTDINGGVYLPSDYRQGGTQWTGDRNLEEAQAAAKAKMKKALTWAKKIAKTAEKTRGWNAETLMYQFQHPEENWGIWPSILKMNGKDPAQYNISAIAKVLSMNPKQSVPTMSGEDALRALDMSEWLPDPSLAKRMLTETPFRADIRAARQDLKTEVAKAAIQTVGTENWFWLGSQQLAEVGIAASPKLDMIQLDLNKDYNALVDLGKKHPGSDEYKAARNAYYAKRDRVLSRVKGGELLIGGIAERIMALPYAMDAQVTSMGTGKNAVSLQVGYDNFVKVRDRELAKDDPSSEHIKEAWDRFVANKDYAPPQAKELTRVAAWAYLLSEGKKLRHDIRTHYSEYYKGPGETPKSDTNPYVVSRKKQLATAIQRLRKWSPEFSKQLDDWFADLNVENAFLNWYDK